MPITDIGQKLDKEQQKSIHEVTGTFLYHVRAVNGTMLTALNALVTEQTNPTTTIMKNMKQFLDYAASNSNATLRYDASDMVLSVHSDS